MAKIVTANQQLITGVQNPIAEYSRVFGLACKAAVGIGNFDLAYSPPLGNVFRLTFMSIWFGGGCPGGECAGTIYISTGTGIPDSEDVATRWEIVVPFWAGTTKPAIMVMGMSNYLHWPMNRLYKGDALRFGMVIENGTMGQVFWVNAWFGISEG